MTIEPTRSSADVRLELHVAGPDGPQVLPLAQIGGGVLIFDRPTVLPGTAGEVLAVIDGNEQRWRVTWRETGRPRLTVAVVMTELSGESR